MNQIISTLFLGLPVLLLSLFITPFLLSRSIAPRASLPGTLLIAAVASLLLHSAIPVGLHAAGIPINRLNLTIIHVCVALIASLIFRLRHTPLLPRTGRFNKRLIVLCGAFAVAVIPLTCLAGIDTYKWLDLAMSMQVEQSIPWLVHPLSLLGFTGRSYPSIQPLVLGSVLILGGMGVEWSFFFVSVLFGTLGILSAYLLGTAIHHNRRDALWLAFLYGFSPVFVRYNHWATGRGLLLALLPLFLLAILRLFTLRGLAILVLTSILLPLSHKAGLIALGGILLSLPAVPLIPRRGARILVPLLAFVAGVGAVLLAPNIGLPFPAGKALGFVRMATVRFGVLLPLAAVGLFCAPDWFTHPTRRRLFPAMILTFPFACPPNMYGALIALIFIAIAASAGISWIESRFSAATPHRRGFVSALIVMLVLLGALAILVHRSLTAMPCRVKKAATFLDSYDPMGPYMIRCKPWRPQLQGYVAGCPRFSVTRTGPVRVIVHPLPSVRGNPSHVLKSWVAHTRHMFSVTGFALDYYGKNPRMYYIVVDNRESVPADAECIYAAKGVDIFKPAGQTVPNPTGTRRDHTGDRPPTDQEPDTTTGHEHP